MKVAVIGAGNVGGGLARAWAKKGHDVTFGVPRPHDATVQAACGGLNNLSAATVREAVPGAEVIVLATPWPATEAALQDAGDLRGRVLVDATNPLLPDFSWLDGQAASGAERVAGWALGARVVKAFNQTGAGNMADPSGYASRPVMFAAGDDAEAKVLALRLIEDAGFEGVDAGPLRVARLLEAYAMLWIHLALVEKQGPSFAFALQRRSPG